MRHWFVTRAGILLTFACVKGTEILGHWGGVIVYH